MIVRHLMIVGFIILCGCSFPKINEKSGQKYERMIRADWYGKELDYERKPYIPYYEYWNKYYFDFQVRGTSNLFVLMKFRDFFVTKYLYRHLYPVQIMNKEEFEQNLGGICKDWAMLYCRELLWPKGYDARFVIGTYGTEDESNLHVWAIVYMGKDVYIVDHQRIVRVRTKEITILSIYHPWFSFQGKKTWVHVDESYLKTILKSMSETFKMLAFNINF